MRFDIYSNRVPFGLLSPDEQKALQDCGGPVEVFSPDGWWSPDMPNFSRHLAYRAVRPAPTPLVVDWSMIAPEYRFAAKDKETGSAFVYDEQPVWYAKDEAWDSMGAGRILDHIIGAVQSWGTCDPKDSLIKRPEGV